MDEAHEENMLQLRREQLQTEIEETLTRLEEEKDDTDDLELDEMVERCEELDYELSVLESKIER